jgi:hypothetical protein
LAFLSVPPCEKLRVIVIAYAEDNSDNQAIPLSTTASRTSSDKGHAVYLPVVLRE